MSIKQRISSDAGISETVEFMFISLLFVVLAVTIIDFGVYFSNKGVIQNASQNGARLAAIYGGDSVTEVARQYSNRKNISVECRNKGIDGPVACAVYEDLTNSGALAQAVVNDVECGPSKTTKIGDRTYCDIKWTYLGIPGSIVVQSGALKDNTTRMTAESEVVAK